MKLIEEKKSRKRALDEDPETKDDVADSEKPQKKKVKKSKSEKKLDSEKKKKKTKKVKVGSTDKENGADITKIDERSEAEIKGDFSNFKISPETAKKLNDAGVKYLFPIQADTFNFVYEGHDLVAQARTGTGKTFSFAIPLVEIMKKKIRTERGRPPKVLVMAPTRELAVQVTDNFTAISDKLKMISVFGGSPIYEQISKLRAGVDVVVGTPGRLLDLLERKNLSLEQVEHVVLDEVDRMLDMGFAESVEAIMNHCSYQGGEGCTKPQTLLFSATMPSWVEKTSKKYMSADHKWVDLVGSQTVRTATTVQHYAIKCGYHDRGETVGDILRMYSGSQGRTMVFTQTKREADTLAVSPDLGVETHVMHGDIVQSKRLSVLQGFRDGRYKCLVTTDVAARGLDIPEVDLVIQCSPPMDMDSYIHRSGRTGRAGREGICVMFYTRQEENDIRRIENHTGIKFKRIGAPTKEDLIKAASRDAARALNDVEDNLLELFRESAASLIAEKGAVHALSAALAVLAGTPTLKTRSLITCQSGFQTYIFRTTQEMRGLGYCWSSIARYVPEEIKETVQNMKSCVDKMGCVFDVPTEHVSVFENSWVDGKFDTLTKATELPEIVDNSSRFRPDRANNGYRGNKSFRGSGKFNSRNSNGFSRFGQNKKNGFGSGNKKTTFVE